MKTTMAKGGGSWCMEKTNLFISIIAERSPTGKVSTDSYLARCGEKKHSPSVPVYHVYDDCPTGKRVIANGNNVAGTGGFILCTLRSEKRRVGKECRSGWWREKE